jgi:hypothetical protein
MSRENVPICNILRGVALKTMEDDMDTVQELVIMQVNDPTNDSGVLDGSDLYQLLKTSFESHSSALHVNVSRASALVKSPEFLGFNKWDSSIVGRSIYLTMNH